MKPRATLLVAALLLGACGAGPIADPTTSLPSSSTTTPPSTEPATVGGKGVRVTITATAVSQPDGSVELCLAGMAGPCPGILLDGDIEPALISASGNPLVIQVTGFYDGQRLVPESGPTAIDYAPMAETDYASLCPDLQGSPSLNSPDDLTAAIGNYVSSQPDYAEMWWDSNSSVLTVWFKGNDVAAHQTAIEALANGEPVCVSGGARFSQAELMEASELINQFRDSRGQPLNTPGYGAGGLSNRIDLAVDEIDGATRAALNDLVGQRVILYPFIELLDDDLSALPAPVPVVPGDVEILTSPIRAGGGMEALGSFTLSYDSDMNCVYFFEPGMTDRIVPVWPFGYSATTNPMIVYDYDGNPVGSEGDQLELGGGNVGTALVEGNTCGAISAWIVNR